MAGTLTISTLSDGTNSSNTTDVVRGSARAWIRFFGNGSTSINSSYNVSSVVRNTTGDYTINFTNALADANYSALVSIGINGSVNSSNSVIQINDNAAAPTTTALRVRSSLASNGTNWEPAIATVAVFR